MTQETLNPIRWVDGRPVHMYGTCKVCASPTVDGECALVRCEINQQLRAEFDAKHPGPDYSAR